MSDNKIVNLPKKRIDNMKNLREVIEGEDYKEWVLFAVTDEGYYSLAFSTDVFRATWLLDNAKDMCTEWDFEKS